jgi:hypothetical protein
LSACRPRAGFCPFARRDPTSHRRPQGRVQPGHRARSARGPGDSRPHASRRHHVHRLCRRRPTGSCGLRRGRCASSGSKWAVRIRWSCCSDADLGNAVEWAINGAYFATGQRCTVSSKRAW